MLKHYILWLLLAGILWMGCSSDHGLEPQPGRLIVDVFFRGTPPASTQGIYLIVAPQFPPHAINELFHSSNSLPINRDSVRTVIDLPYGHYDAISLWWYSNATESNLADVLALPLVQDSMGVFQPMDFNLSASNPIDSVQLYASWDKVNRDASLEGTIYFNGPFPKSTLATAVAAYSIEPKSNIEYLTYMKSIDFSVGANPYHYKLPIRNGTVSYLVVLWLPARASMTQFLKLGHYQNPAAPGSPAILKIKPGERRTGLDIYADWSLAQ